METALADLRDAALSASSDAQGAAFQVELHGSRAQLGNFARASSFREFQERLGRVMELQRLLEQYGAGPIALPPDDD